MSTFEIRVDEEGPCVRGHLRIGSFQESFELLLGYWKRADYEAQWRSALRALQSGGHRTALITTMVDPERGNFLTWWPMFRDGERVFVQQSLLFLDQLDRPFDPEDAADFVEEREVVSEEGDRISEWETSVAAIAAFLEAK